VDSTIYQPVSPSKNPPTTWNVPEVCAWLDFKQLSHLKPIFTEQRIRGAALLSMTEQIMKEELKLPYGDRVDLADGIRELKVEYSL
jgi:hypothetical protein